MALDLKHLVVHRILNWPTPEQRQAGQEKQARRRAARAGGGDSEPSTSPGTPANPWAQLSTSTAPAPTSSETRPIQTPTGVPWQLSTPSQSSIRGRQVLRALLAVVLALFAWIGFRSTFLDRSDDDGANAVAAPELPATATFDAIAAAGAAERFAIATLTWNAEGDPEARLAAIAAGYSGTRDPITWNGEGRQDVVDAIAAGVGVADDGQSAIVTVLVQVQRYTATDDAAAPWRAGVGEWLTVQVPVAVDAETGRVLADGGPALVGDANLVTYPPSISSETDPAMTTDTAATAEAFFGAYGDGDVSAVAAPGAVITAPQSAFELGDLAVWQVAEGEGETRYARASVEWSIAETGEQITSSYLVALTQVTGGGADRWEVSAITATPTAG